MVHVRFFLTATCGGIIYLARGVPMLVIFHKFFIHSTLSGTHLYMIQYESSYKYDFSFRLLHTANPAMNSVCPMDRLFERPIFRSA
jgi:hypothetical protein